MSEEKTTEIRPYKWSSWGIEIYSRENRNGRLEYAYIIDEQKWAWIGIEGDYELLPVDQHPLIAPLFADPDDMTSMYFVIDGRSMDNEAEGGNRNTVPRTTFGHRVRHTCRARRRRAFQ